MFKKFVIFIFIVATIIFLGAMVLYFSYRAGFVSKIILNNIDIPEQKNNDTSNLFQKILGFDKKQTYLLLFMNNTELRPGGGFIGAYAVLEVDKGIPVVVKVEGTEIFDNEAARETVVPPPAPLAKYLKTNRWNFRDSNWSPDFAVSAAQALKLYKAQGGVKGEEINAVIGFTPTLIEEILKVSGPIKVNGEEFNYKNFTEKLEYEVEYNYEKRGLNFAERKQMLKDVTYALAKRLGESALLNWSEYFSLMNRMFGEKQIAVYSLDKEFEQMVVLKDWGGKIKGSSSSDYLLWVDANLGALKTDFSIRRSLSYTFYPDKSGRYMAEVKMKYVHAGKFDWRTTRYLSYVRMYAPAGSVLIETQEIMNGKKTVKKDVDAGEEFGKKWFGHFISIEPGATKELVFKFYLAPGVVAMIQKGDYSLLAQKQIGSVGTKFILDFDFDRTVSAADPGELELDWGNKNYSLKTDLKKDRNFSIRLAE